MEANRIIKKYKKEDLTILWEPKKCIHAAICVKELPEVYDPNDKPWIKPENAPAANLKKQIDLCPSGALSYEENESSIKKTNMATEVELMKNGPLLVKGNIELKSHDGSVVTKEKMTAFCRCGASSNKPYCDGKHKQAGFEG
ncbi:(4Fe-4S)-binding protein [Lutimonas halocynthiae]|uniref:(4Fe-4S)-binding protein n=1 Tax=Lutimonas halocynthiae TaxID=1446477 RepID=UPI0025B3C736|nr:(4Fe-4S)-binding protein [Lutimonas halocynthiae]MDN3644097.1 (4Fe-4S)-binding protein [Lutimonas halocynthiae]